MDTSLTRESLERVLLFERIMRPLVRVCVSERVYVSVLSVREREEIERAKEKVYCIGNTLRATHTQKSNNS